MSWSRSSASRREPHGTSEGRLVDPQGDGGEGGERNGAEAACGGSVNMIEAGALSVIELRNAKEMAEGDNFPHRHESGLSTTTVEFGCC